MTLAIAIGALLGLVSAGVKWYRRRRNRPIEHAFPERDELGARERLRVMRADRQRRDLW